MKQSRKTLMLALVAVMTLSFAFAGTASAKMVKKVDNFIFFLDQSGSMAQKHSETGKKKIDMALEVMQSMNKAIPSLDYTSALLKFAPFEAVSQPGAYDQSAMADAATGVATDFDIFNRRTNMGGGLLDIDPIIGSLSGKTGLILFTDGNANIGVDPIAQAKALYAKYGDNLCVHVVSFADTDHGKKVVEGIRALSSCTVPADYASLTAAGAMDQYVKDVFYEDVAEPAPKPAPVVVPTVKETISFNLNFGFDKSQITDEMLPILEQAKQIINEDMNARFEVAGHTDSTGPEAYNQKLSERRAASVKNWLVENGVSASRLEAVGFGENAPKYDNSTREGRKLNRRVEIKNK